MDVHWSHTPSYSLRLSPPAPSHGLAPPRTSSTRAAPSKPRAPLGLRAEVAARARGRDRRGHGHQRPARSPRRAETQTNHNAVTGTYYRDGMVPPQPLVGVFPVMLRVVRQRGFIQHLPCAQTAKHIRQAGQSLNQVEVMVWYGMVPLLPPVSVFCH
jgi:hypothetical protein